MKDLTVRRLSDYPVEELETLQLMLSILYEMTKIKGHTKTLQEIDGWGYRIREAIKEANEEKEYEGAQFI